MLLRIRCALLLAVALTASTAGAANRLLVRDATLITMAPGTSAAFTGYLVVGADGKIVAVGAGEPPASAAADEVIEAAGKIVIPGFISAHSHVWQSALRGLGADQYVRGWGQAVRVYSASASDEDLYWFTLHGALDHLQHGITGVYNFAWSVKPGEHNKEQFQALVDSGIRYAHSYAEARTSPADQRYKDFAAFVKWAKPHFKDPQFLRLAISGTADNESEVRFDKRLMDEFEVVSSNGNGTTVTMKKWREVRS